MVAGFFSFNTERNESVKIFFIHHEFQKGIFKSFHYRGTVDIQYYFQAYDSDSVHDTVVGGHEKCYHRKNR